MLFENMDVEMKKNETRPVYFPAIDSLFKILEITWIDD